MKNLQTEDENALYTVWRKLGRVQGVIFIVVSRQNLRNNIRLTIYKLANTSLLLRLSRLVM